MLILSHLPTLEEFFLAHGILTRQPRVVRPFHRRIFRAITQWVAGTLPGGARNLAICIPPRHGKTFIANDLVAWGLLCFPDSEWIYTSYSASLAIAQTLAIKECCASDWYRAIAPYVGVEAGKGRQDYFRTSMGGAVYGVGTEGSLTGFGAGKKRPEFGGGIVIDDPLVAMDALTVRRDKCNLWYSQALYSRRNAAHTPIMLIMQRLHERDLVGHVQASEPGQWHILNIPVVGDNDEMLWPQTFDAGSMERLQTIDPFAFSAQYMQQPTPPGGAMIKTGWVQRFAERPTDVTSVGIFCDTAQKTGQHNDFTVFLLAGTDGQNVFILDLLQNIMELAPYEYRGAGQVITSEVAMYAGQAAAARDQALSLRDATHLAATRAEGAAGKSETARDAAVAASQLAVIKADEAEELVQRATDRIVYFEKEVVTRVEAEATKLTNAATTAVIHTRDQALTSLEERTVDILTEITGVSVQLKTDAIQGVNRAKEQALSELDAKIEEGVAEFHEEGELFKEDFLQLTDRAEAAAKKAGCASVAAQNHADRACLCADRAEIAADAAEAAVDTVVEAARAAEASKICAEAAATNAEKSAREAAASKDEALHAANGVKADAQAIKADADRAVTARDEAEGFRDEAGASATAAAASATLAKAEADRSQKYAEDTEAELIKIAVELLVPDVITEAVAQATDTATAAATTATTAAAEAAASAQEAQVSETAAKADADRAVAAREVSEDISGKLLKDYQVEVHMVELSAQMTRLTDFVTKHLLGHSGGGSLGGGTADAIDAAGEAVTLRVKEYA